MTTDYGPTIHLPQTDFPRRAGLAQKEPQIQARWDKMDLYKRQREASKGREKFILHMGPPFANGNIHLGHVLSTVLKDVVTRSYQNIMGKDAPLVPGFDCHGLPIEWKIEEEYRAKGNTRGKDDDRVAFLKACRNFAANWVTVQSAEFQRLGILGDFKDPYLTMAKKSEATIAGTVHEFLRNGGLYRGSKPVMWSVPEETALAEAEIEYKDMTSDTAWVKFPIKSGPKELEGASVVIWTTTPWTLPGNRAIAYGAEIDYALVTVTAVLEDSIVKVGDRFFIAQALVPAFMNSAKIAAQDSTVFAMSADELFKGATAHHPLQAQGYTFDVPLLAGDFVTTDAGTGFVHIAPGHGEDDYRLVATHNQNNPTAKIEIPETVRGDGKYYDSVPLFAGVEVYSALGKKGPANKFVMNAIAEAGHLVAKNQITHSYPHSWRSKAPVIFRNTPQWFVSMDTNDLRKKALAEIEKTRFVPERGKNRIGAMVEGRGDWCISRQRVWGVPLAIFYHKDTLEPLRDEKVLKRIIDIFEEHGSESWYERPASDFLGPDYKPEDYVQVRDIVDVWMESGVTQDFVLSRPELQWPADLYLEGSDQHRGWFQSSLLVATGTKGKAPYKSILTHGFILDEKGYKMSKSVGNVASPTKMMENYGADILRLWAVSSDYTEDTKFGENILKFHADVYRRLRGTFCYLLGSLDGTGDKTALSDLDKYILHRVFEIDRDIRKCIADYDFKGAMGLVNNFCTRELSAFYFDICKDSLYCDALDSAKRRAIVYTLEQVFIYLCHWLSPALAFTTEEAWLSYKGLTLEDTTESIHLSVLEAAPQEWHDASLNETWDKIIAARSVVTGALEIARTAKDIGASLEAAPKVYVSDTALLMALKNVSFADICITSGIEIHSGGPEGDGFTVQGVEGVSVVFAKANGQKCERCWKYTTDTGAVAGHPAACARCGEAVEKEAKSRAA